MGQSLRVRIRAFGRLAGLVARVAPMLGLGALLLGSPLLSGSVAQAQDNGSGARPPQGSNGPGPAVPEPTALALFAVGAAAVAFSLRGRRRR